MRGCAAAITSQNSCVWHPCPLIHPCSLTLLRNTDDYAPHIQAVNPRLNAQVIAIVRIDLCYGIRHAHRLSSNESVYLMLSHMLMKCKPLLSAVMIPVAHWCYFYVLAENIDEICSVQTTKTQTFLPLGFTKQNSHKQDPSFPTILASQSRTRC